MYQEREKLIVYSVRIMQQQVSEEVKRKEDDQHTFEEESAQAFKQFMSAHFCQDCQKNLV